MKTIFSLMFALSVSQTAAPKATGETGRLAYVAFECSAYAEFAGEPQKEVTRLFQLGYDNGKRFLEAALRSDISEAEIRKTIPIAMLWVLSGPTVDFRLGRIYSAALEYAGDRVTKQDQNGVQLPVREWRTDKELQKTIGSSEYRTRNCSLLK